MFIVMDPQLYSTPGASSSRVTLDMLESPAHQSSLRHPIKRRKLNIPSSAIQFVITLSLAHTASAQPTSSPVKTDKQDITRRLLHLSSDLLNRRNRSKRAGFTVPDNYIVLNQTFWPGFVVVSYLIALIGSFCTLELLIRRTSNSGWRNQVLLTSAGICFGAVSTFSMHFIFNNALNLHHPLIANDAIIVLSYVPSYTILSLVASCSAMTLAFFVMGTNIADWRSLPSSFKGRSNKRERKGESLELKRQAEEYKRWKRAHGQKGVVRGLGDLFMGAIATVSKWSLVDESHLAGKNQNQHWGKGESGKKINDDYDDDEEEEEDRKYMTIEDEMIMKDDNLREMEFRLGKSAVSKEIESRRLKIGGGGDDGYSHQHTLSNGSFLPTSMPSIPDPAITARPPSSSASRRPSLGTNKLSVEYSDTTIVPSSTSVITQSTFTPGYSFPPRRHRSKLTINSSTANLLHNNTNGDSIGGGSVYTDSELPSPSWTRRSSMENPFHLHSHHNHHNAQRSVAMNSSSLSMDSTAHLQQDSYFSQLDRIKSVPETITDENRISMSPAVGDVDDQDSKINRTPRLEDGLNRLGEDGMTIRSNSYTNRVEKESHWIILRAEKFLGFDVVTRGEVIKICLTGTIAGMGVAGMHYIGQLSIVGMPFIGYDPGYVIGSIVIAAGAVVIALYIMFIMLRPKLKHGFFYKLCIAVILAIAVCSMHFCGMMGTTYAWPIDAPVGSHDILSGTNQAITGIVAALAFAACLACGVFFFVETLRARKEKRRRRRVVVAAIMLDEFNRILVNSTDGLPPMCDIASLSGEGMPSSKNEKISRNNKSSNHNSDLTSTDGGSTILGMDLTPGHEAFVSALRLSWFWRTPEYLSLNPFSISTTSVNANNGSGGGIGGGGGMLSPMGNMGNRSILPSIDNSIQEIRRGSFNTLTSSVPGSNKPSKISVTKFLERFVVSAGELAVKLTGQEDGIQRLGILYDQILTTGWVKLSNSTDTVSKGQLIIMVRRVVSQQERNDLLTRHFIFAHASAVAMALQKTLSVPLDHMAPLLEDVQKFCDSTSLIQLQPGTLYAGVAVVQATPFDGLRILLEQSNRSQLPMREICQFHQQTTSSTSINDLIGTVADLGEAIAELEGMTLLSLISQNIQIGSTRNSYNTVKNEKRTEFQMRTARVSQLSKALESAIVPMLDEMLNEEDMEHVLPRLTLHPVLVPLTPGKHYVRPEGVGINNGSGGGVKSYIPPYMICFYANYDAAVNTFTDKWLPFNLFRCQNQCTMAPFLAEAWRLVKQQDALEMGNNGNKVNGGMPGAGGRRPSKVQFDFSGIGQSGVPQLSPKIESEEFGLENEGLTPNNENLPVKSDYTIGAGGSGSNGRKGGIRKSSFAKPKDNSVDSSIGLMSPGSIPMVVGGSTSGSSDTAVGSNNLHPISAMTSTRQDSKDGVPEGLVAQGVAAWDPDWLPTILKNKLRAEA